MKTFRFVALCGLALASAIGCASTKVTDRDPQIRNEKLARPGHIYVYPFAANHDDLQQWANAGDRFAEPDPPPTREQVEAGRELGVLVAKEMVTKIKEMGLVASPGGPQSVPRTNDIMLTGYFGAIDQGSGVKRMALGFGSGATELTTAVEGYQMTTTGPRLLGSAEIESGGGKTPGLVVPLAVFAATANPIGLVVMGSAKVAGEATGRSGIEGAAKRTAGEISDQLRVKFQEQGWIQ